MDEQLGRGTTTDDGFGLFLHLLFVSFSCILDTMTYLQLMTALAFCVFFVPATDDGFSFSPGLTWLWNI